MGNPFYYVDSDAVIKRSDQELHRVVREMLEVMEREGLSVQLARRTLALAEDFLGLSKLDCVRYAEKTAKDEP